MITIADREEVASVVDTMGGKVESLFWERRKIRTNAGELQRVASASLPSISDVQKGGLLDMQLRRKHFF